MKPQSYCANLHAFTMT